ncbi:hypothetical protein COO91_07821 [Nostoc flagelliforme CCNUN1]|uniref:Uncharacterized protein n=1 Tax=Nostoc flagelliforme CCNUN1 TaxID=2038116 RepID=A0A2K8T227_9NOSO|nr:hypothetical protein [Nostoc flagelliforme]AUB41754.1 hypothetical protein COO91_07821 [Nostoc flagelliforme CCNUN1]
MADYNVARKNQLFGTAYLYGIMKHPFDLKIAELESIDLKITALSDDEANQVCGGFATVTKAIGEEGGRVTTLAIVEEGGTATTLALGEEGGVATTKAVGEEGGRVTTLALGEEGGGDLCRSK